MEFSRQEYWSGLPFLSPGDLLTQWLKLSLLHCWQILYHLSQKGSPKETFIGSIEIDSHLLQLEGRSCWGSSLVQFSSVSQSCPILCDSMDCSMPVFPVPLPTPELTQTHVHQVGDAIQPSHPLSSPSSAFNLSQHQGLFRWVSSSHQVAKVLEFQLQHQSFQWKFRTDFL